MFNDSDFNLIDMVRSIYIIGGVLALLLSAGWIIFVKIPGYVIRGYRWLMQIIAEKLPVTAAMIRAFVIELALVEFIYEFMPALVGGQMLNSRFLMNIYDIIIDIQWNREICERIVLFITNNLVAVFVSCPGLLKVVVCMLIGAIIVLGVMICALILNAKYLVFGITADLLFGRARSWIAWYKSYKEALKGLLEE